MIDTNHKKKKSESYVVASFQKADAVTQSNALQRSLIMSRVIYDNQAFSTAHHKDSPVHEHLYSIHFSGLLHEAPRELHGKAVSKATRTLRLRHHCHCELVSPSNHPPQRRKNTSISSLTNKSQFSTICVIFSPTCANSFHLNYNFKNIANIANTQ